MTHTSTHLVFLVRDGGSVDLVLPDAGRRDGPGEPHLAVVVVRVLVDEGGAGLEAAGGGGGDLTGRAEDQVLHLLRPEVARLHAEDEGDGVHEVGLAGPVGPDHAGEVVERPDPLQAGVGLEVLELEVGDRHGGWLLNIIFAIEFGVGDGILEHKWSSDDRFALWFGRIRIGYPDAMCWGHKIERGAS
jgi:hypothetical protein